MSHSIQDAENLTNKHKNFNEVNINDQLSVEDRYYDFSKINSNFIAKEDPIKISSNPEIIDYDKDYQQNLGDSQAEEEEDIEEEESEEHEDSNFSGLIPGNDYASHEYISDKPSIPNVKTSKSNNANIANSSNLINSSKHKQNYFSTNENILQKTAEFQGDKEYAYSSNDVSINTNKVHHSSGIMGLGSTYLQNTENNHNRPLTGYDRRKEDFVRTKTKSKQSIEKESVRSYELKKDHEGEMLVDNNKDGKSNKGSKLESDSNTGSLLNNKDTEIKRLKTHIEEKDTLISQLRKHLEQTCLKSTTTKSNKKSGLIKSQSIVDDILGLTKHEAVEEILIIELKTKTNIISNQNIEIEVLNRKLNAALNKVDAMKQEMNQGESRSKHKPKKDSENQEKEEEWEDEDEEVMRKKLKKERSRKRKEEMKKELDGLKSKVEDLNKDYFEKERLYVDKIVSLQSELQTMKFSMEEKRNEGNIVVHTNTGVNMKSPNNMDFKLLDSAFAYKNPGFNNNKNTNKKEDNEDFLTFKN